MPINRGDKHWCNPGEDGSPSARSGAWTCPECKTRWKFWPDLNVWALAGEDPLPPAPDVPVEDAPKEGDQ